MKLVHFKETEFACKHCGLLPRKGINKILLAKLDHLRCAIGAPIIVSSGYRCAKHNANVGGVANSQHIKGTAADIICKSVSVEKLAAKAKEIGFDGIGIYPKSGFVHVDCRSDGDEPCKYNWSE